MEDPRVLLLNKHQIQQKLERIAFQIIESNFEEKEIIICGIKNKGYFLAKQLTEYLKKHSKIKVTLNSITLDKKNPLSKPVQYDLPEKDLDGKVIIIMDDVANTGRTLFYAMKPLQEHRPKKVQVAVLVDRKHKTFPVSADFVGLSLATTVQEHIELEMKGDTVIYLS